MYKRISTALVCCLLTADISIASDDPCSVPCREQYDRDMSALKQDYEGALAINRIAAGLDSTVATRVKADLDELRRKKEAFLAKVLENCEIAKNAANCG